jgi:hypothetical protein
MDATGRSALAAVIFIASCIVISAAGAEPDNTLACELVSLAKVEQVFGLPHAVIRPKATSPTAPSPNNHTVAGSDQSECDVYAYGAVPSAAELAGMVRSAANPNVPVGIGSVIVTTNVRDDTTAGDNGAHWDPENYVGHMLQFDTILKHKLHGEWIGVPKYGSDRFAMWIGNKNHAVGIWQIGGGVITINVLAAGGTAPTKLIALAKLFVPKFAPFAGS